ncbi:hypothetical protein [Devosia marina]|uniref:Cap15 family cyclic dinucleotide receptor domain-containing protein n=1 Tax=Devosia marina TaxID=2683198 RepID=UPI003CCDFDA0
MPHIDGIWEVTLQSTYTDPNTGQKISPIVGTMIVTQTLSTLVVRLETSKQSSQTLGYSIRDVGGGAYEVLGVYQSDPTLEHRVGSPIHYGTFKLRLDQSPLPTLQGHYWTDRNTSGQFTARNRQPRPAVGITQRLFRRGG